MNLQQVTPGLQTAMNYVKDEIDDIKTRKNLGKKLLDWHRNRNSKLLLIKVARHMIQHGLRVPADNKVPAHVLDSVAAKHGCIGRGGMTKMNMTIFNEVKSAMEEQQVSVVAISPVQPCEIDAASIRHVIAEEDGMQSIAAAVAEVPNEQQHQSPGVSSYRPEVAEYSPPDALSQGFDHSQTVSRLSSARDHAKTLSKGKKQKAATVPVMEPQEILRCCKEQKWPNLKIRQNLFRRQRGLFAWKENGKIGEDVVFEKGTIVCCYDGTIIPGTEYDEMIADLEQSGQHDMVHRIKAYACGNKQNVILAHDETVNAVAKSYGRLMNHSRHGNVYPPARKMIGNNQVFLMRARRKIFHGEELTWNYGRGYYYGVPSFEYDCYNYCCYKNTMQKYRDEYEAYKSARDAAIEDERVVFQTQISLMRALPATITCPGSETEDPDYRY